jgi:hypothetical protein
MAFLVLFKEKKTARTSGHIKISLARRYFLPEKI